jgi:hypothetical protein
MACLTAHQRTGKVWLSSSCLQLSTAVLFTCLASMFNHYTVILQGMGLAPPNEHDGCRTYFTAQAQDMAELAAAGTPPVVLLSDGGCSTQRKLQLAVANGAVAVLITLSNLTTSVDLAWCVWRVESLFK